MEVITSISEIKKGETIPLVAGELVELFPNAKTMPDRQASAIYAVRMPGRSHAAKAQLFISHLKAHIGDPPYRDRR